MKNTKLIALFTINFLASSFSLASESDCQVKFFETSKTAILSPIYEARVTYLFDDTNQSATAQVFWAYSNEKTSQCFQNTQRQNPGYELSVALMDVPELQVEVLHGQNQANLQIYQQPGSQFHGQTDMLSVNYQKKRQILNAIEHNRTLVNFSGRFKYRYEETQRNIVRHIQCLKNHEQTGFVALHKRLKELVETVQSYSSQEAVNKEQILEDFLGECLEIAEGNGQGLKGLSRQIKLVQGELPVYGNVTTVKYQNVPFFSVMENTHIEY